MASQFNLQSSVAVKASAFAISALIVAGFMNLLESERAQVEVNVAQVLAVTDLSETVLAEAPAQPAKVETARKRV